MKNYHNTLLLTLTLSFSAYGSILDLTTPEHAVKHARAVRPEIQYEYLTCYALEETAKKECIRELTEKYMPKDVKDNKEYAKAFQFEAEKQGFKRFLNDKKLPCERIDEGPKFSPNKKAYLVICRPKSQYLMRFDYDSKTWMLIE